MRSAALLLFLAAACGSDPKIVSVSLSPSTIAPGGTVTVSVEVENIDLHAVGSALRPAHGDEEGSTEGHLHAYLDSTETNPLAMTSSASFPLTVPAATMAGAHEVIVRLHNADHTIHEPEVTGTAALTVQ